MPTVMTADDLLAGILAELRLRDSISDTIVLPVSGTRLDSSLRHVFSVLEELADDFQVELGFRIRPHRVHGDSTTVRDAISVLVQSRLASLDNPQYQHLRVNLSEQEADRLLNSLPGGPPLYRRLATEFLQAFAPSGV